MLKEQYVKDIFGKLAKMNGIKEDDKDSGRMLEEATDGKEAGSIDDHVYMDWLDEV